MKKYLFLLLTGIFAACSSPIEVTNLQCEYMEDPIGIDVGKPRFAWELTDDSYTRGQKQTAYHILVASDKKLLDKNTADVWDSGKTPSEQSFLIPFEGQALVSSQEYFWKVQVYDKDGNPSKWSTPARFVTGLLYPEEWTEAQWIKRPSAPERKHVWFRKNFSLPSSARSALIHVASVGYHELYVNGKKADDRVLAPAATYLPKRTLVVTYDISDLLQPGENVIAVWQASGWASYVEYRVPSCLRVRLDIKAKDDSKLTIYSDTDWRCAVSNSEDTRDNHQHTDNGGELIDARTYIPDWNRIGFDDSQWDKAVTTTCNVEINSHTLIEPTRIIETLKPVSITGEGVYKIDLGKNFTGWVKIDMSGLASGDTVTIQASDGTDAVQDFGQLSQYISNGAQKETFCNHFNYLCGRYITVSGLKQKPAPEDVTGYALGTDLKRTGHFVSSNDLFNQIYETDLWTFRANTIEGYTADCPHRERLGYGEVAFATSWGIGLPNYQTDGFYRKCLFDWEDVQRPDGYIPHTAPQTFGWGGPMWSTAGMNIAREHYLHFGDKQIYEQYYPTAKRWLNFLHKHTNEKSGLFTVYTEPGFHKFLFLGDWLRPGDVWEDGDSPQAQYFNNCVYVLNLEIIIEMAEKLGYPEDVELYGKRLQTLKKRINDTFFKPDSNIYSDGNQVQMAFALSTGITPDDRIPEVTANFKKEFERVPYFDMGSSGLPVLFRYLVSHPEYASATAHHFNQNTEPSYGYFLERGETAWPEYWSVDMESRIHTCYTGVASWFVKSLCGIQPDIANPGYKSFIIRPAIVSEVHFVEASVESPYGKILSRWERNENQVNLSVTVPPNSKATVYIPSGSVENVTENGLPVNDAKGIIVQGIKEDCLVVSVEAGQYHFIWKL